MPVHNHHAPRQSERSTSMHIFGHRRRPPGVGEAKHLPPACLLPVPRHKHRPRRLWERGTPTSPAHDSTTPAPPPDPFPAESVSSWHTRIYNSSAPEGRLRMRQSRYGKENLQGPILSCFDTLKPGFPETSRTWGHRPA